MDEFKRFVQTRVMVDALRFLDLAAQGYTLVCVNLGVLEALRIFIEGYGKREVNWYVSLEPGGYWTPDSAQWDIMQDYIDEFLGETNVTCDEFISALNSISQAINNSGARGCCVPGSSGLNGSGPSAQPANSFSDTGSNFPDGFTDRDEWLFHRCGYIEYLLANISGDLDRASVVAIVGITLSALLSGLGFVLLTPIPFDDLIVLCLAVITALATPGLFASAIAEAKTVINSDELKCALYNGTSATDAASDAAQEVLDQTAALSEPLRTITRDILNSFLTMDVVNSMFVDDGREYPEGDCSVCTPPCESGFSIERGTGPSIPNFADPAGYTSEFIAGPNCHYIQVTSFDTGLPVKFVSISGWGSCNPPDQFRIASSGDGTAGDLYSADTFPTGQCFDPGPTGNLAFIFSGTGPFTVVLDCCD